MSKRLRGAGIGEQLRHGIDAILIDATRLAKAEDVEESTRVHGTRTRIKRIRALLALLHADLGRARFRSEERALRNVARTLGPLRDPVARLEAYEQLNSCGLMDLPREWYRELTRGGDDSPNRREVAARILSQAAAELAATQVRVESWPSLTDDTSSLARGFLRNYAAARRASRSAERNPTPEAMHALRRRTKRYQYHLQFLKTLQHSQMRARCRRVKILSELLGQHRDLILLGAALDETRGPNTAALRKLRQVLERREHSLRRQALSLARRVYRKRRSLVARRLQRRLKPSTRYAPVALAALGRLPEGPTGWSPRCPATLFE